MEGMRYKQTHLSFLLQRKENDEHHYTQHLLTLHTHVHMCAHTHTNVLNTVRVAHTCPCTLSTEQRSNIVVCSQTTFTRRVRAWLSGTSQKTVLAYSLLRLTLMGFVTLSCISSLFLMMVASSFCSKASRSMYARDSGTRS